MRNPNFIALHRGGLLSKQNHFKLMEWACKCSERVLPLLGMNIDNCLIDALEIGQKWIIGKSTVGDARKASVECHRLARLNEDQILIAVARSCGHAVATAHMADHSLGAAIYALKAVKFSNNSVEDERNWQNNLLDFDLKNIVIPYRFEKEMRFKDLKEFK